MPGWPIKFSAAWSYVPESQRTSLAGIGRGAASVGYFRPGRTERPAQVGQIGAKAWVRAPSLPRVIGSAS
jgi:hypothetical protein